MKLLSTALLGTGLTLATMTTATAATEMRCSHLLPPQHVVSKVIDGWAARVEELSKGEIDVQVFGANALAGPNDNIPSVARGTFECAFALNFQWGRTLPAMNVTLRPYSFSDLEMWRAWPTSAPAEYLEGLIEAKGLKNVAWLFQTNTSVFTSNDKFLIGPDDFKSVKIRGINAAFDSALNALGAATTSLPGSEVYQALSTGVIDAGMTDVAAAYVNKYHEVQDHMVITPVISVFWNGFVNPRFYDGLSDSSKAALEQAGKEAAVWAIDDAQAAMIGAPAQLEEAGVKLYVATDAENETLRVLMQPAFDEVFIKGGGKEVRTLLDLIDEMRQ